MSTRSFIGKQHDDGIVAVYCHYDGYPDGVGQMLAKHYQHEKKIDTLLSLGDMSSLAESIDCPEGHSFATPVDGYTVFYGRDRGDKNMGAKKYYSEAQYKRAARQFWVNFVYLYKGGQWEVFWIR